MQLQIDDEQLKINAIDGIMVIKDHSGKMVVIEEQPLLVFEQFYKKWSAAMKLGGKDEFLNAWVYNQPFRQLISDCLSIFGIDEPSNFTLSQLEALLITYKEGTGLIFQLHNTFPKLLVQAPEAKTWTISLQTVLNLATSMLQEYTHTKNWMEKIPAQLGLYLVSCASWLSNRMPKLLATQKLLKVYEQKNGQRALKILK